MVPICPIALNIWDGALECCSLIRSLLQRNEIAKGDWTIDYKSKEVAMQAKAAAHPPPIGAKNLACTIKYKYVTLIMSYSPVMTVPSSGNDLWTTVNHAWQISMISTDFPDRQSQELHSTSTKGGWEGALAGKWTYALHDVTYYYTYHWSQDREECAK